MAKKPHRDKSGRFISKATWKKKLQYRRSQKSNKKAAAEAKLIQKIEWIIPEDGYEPRRPTYREAMQIRKESVFDVIRRQGETFEGRYLDIGGGKYRRVRKGKEPRPQNVYGRKMSKDDVLRARTVGWYRAGVRNLVIETGKSERQVRAMIRAFHKEMEANRRYRVMFGIPGRNAPIRYRDVIAVIKHSDRYPKLREKYGI